MGVEPKNNIYTDLEECLEFSENGIRSQQNTKKPVPPIGWINDQEQLCLTDLDIHKLHQKFGSLNAIRKFNEGKKIAEKKRTISQEKDIKY